MSLWEVLYLATIAGIITLEHRLFAKAWQRYERARITMGVATVTGLAFPLTLTGILDFHTWLILFFGFGVAGAVTVGLYTYEDANKDNQRAGSIRSAISERAKRTPTK